MVAVIAMFGQQITGQAFSSQYSVVFYQSEGYKSQAFLFNILSNVTGLVCLIATWFIIDQVGRRPMLMTGGTGMAIFLFVVGGVGVVKNPTNSERGGLVSLRTPFSCEIAYLRLLGGIFHIIHLLLQPFLGSCFIRGGV
jgi:SP family sugar:H+ symporter-like MFS transporter